MPTTYADLLKDVLKDGSAFNKRVKLLWFSAGTNETSFFNRQKELRDLLTKSGIKAEYYISNGTAHEWLTWRRSLHQFAPLLFRY